MTLGLKYFAVAILIIFQLFCLIHFVPELDINPETEISSEVRYPQSDNFQFNFSHNREYDKWILDFLLHMKPTQNEVPFTTQELEFHNRLRQVLLFGIHEVNRKLEGTNCTKWWANPLSALHFGHHVKNFGLIVYSLIVEMQPDSIPFKLIVEVQTQSRRNQVETLTLVEAQRLDTSLGSCAEASTQIQKLCHCTEEVEDAEIATVNLRETWAISDPELVTWPPNSSFMVADYLTVGSLRNYLQYPKKNAVDYCGTKTKLVIFVSTAPGDTKRRKAIRNTYASPEALKNFDAKVLFITDRDRNSTIQNLVREESKMFDDIIQADHIHSYHNLTLRYLNIFNWLEVHCKRQQLPLTPWILKTDGDYFINIPLALRAISRNPEVEIMGGFNCGQVPVRDVAYMFKYYTPRYIFTARKFPGYVSGATWLVRSDVIPNLLRASLKIPMIHVDDVYVMGILPRAIHIQPKNLKQIQTTTIKHGPCEVKQRINVNVMNYTDVEYHWKYLNQPVGNDCKLDEAQLIAQPPSKADIDICFFSL